MTNGNETAKERERRWEREDALAQARRDVEAAEKAIVEWARFFTEYSEISKVHAMVKDLDAARARLAEAEGRTN